MSRTTTSLSDVLADADRAEPHAVRGGATTPTAWRDAAAIAPAGGIVSTADDAIRWLELQLGFGSAGDLRRPALTTHRVVAPVPEQLSPYPELDFVGYGLGWVAGSYRGIPLVWHNGGVDGFATQTVLLPRERIGILSSVNVLDTATSLGLTLTVADALLGVTAEVDWCARSRAVVEQAQQPEQPEQPEQQSAAAEGAPAPGWPLPAYAGVYAHPGYGELVVSEADATLSVSLLGSAVDARHRAHETWDLTYGRLDVTFPVTFGSGPDGAVTTATLPLDAATGPIRFERVDRQGTTTKGQVQ
jgi:hypothetical protein